MPRGRSSRCGPHRRGLIAVCIVLASLVGLSGCGISTHPVTPPASASANQPSAAVLGYVWDSRLPGIRPVTGSLGAAHLEGPVAGSSVTTAIPCAGRNFALTADSAGVVEMISLPAGQTSKLGNPLGKNTRILLSPSCSNAIAFATGSASGLLISGLPSTPLVQSINLGSSASIAGAAVSDSGSVLVAGVNSDGSANLQLLPQAGPSQSLKQLQRFGAMTFIAGSDSAVIADVGANVVFLGTRLSANPAFTQIASSAQGVSNPVAAAASADGHFAFVANGSGTAVLRIDLSGASAPLPIQCSCTPSELIPLFGNAGFQLSDPAAGTIFAIDGDAKTPRALFIPTDKVATSAGGAQ